MFHFSLDDAQQGEEASYLLDRATWLVRLRWLVILGASSVVLGASYRGILSATKAPIGLILALAVYNLFLARVWLRRQRGVSAETLRRSVFLQLAVDVTWLVALLHFADAVENPYVALYVLPVTLGAMLLDRRQGLILVLLACGLHGLVILGENLGMLRHYPIVLGPQRGASPLEMDEVHDSGLFVLAHLSATWVTLLGSHFFVRSVVERRLRAEALQRQHERVAESRARLAHVGEISSGVAHAVRNPLHGLMNCVELLEPRLSSDPAAVETLALMNEGLHRIETVTQRLLLLMRESPLSRRATEVNDLVADCLKFVPGRARGKDLVIHTEFGNVGCLDIDPERVAEAISNILDNAVDANSSGGALSVQTRESDLDEVAISIGDQGSGMTVEELGQAFHPFFTTKPIGQGTGLGLAIAKRVMDQHGGRIQLDSVLGKGTRVTLLFPRLRQPDAETPS